MVASCCPSAQITLDRVNRHAACIASGCPRNSESESLLREMRLIPMRWMAKEEAARMYERGMRVPVDNPLRATVETEAPRNKKGQLRLQIKAWREMDGCTQTKQNLMPCQGSSY